MSKASPFWEKVRRGAPDECWPWVAAFGTNGYGAAWLARESRVVNAHRVAFELAKGPIPTGLHILHSCDNKPCCNPAHLSAGTHADNMHDMFRKNGRVAAKRLSDDDVQEIRWLAANEIPYRDVARAYGVDSSYVSRLRSRRSRRDVPEVVLV